MISSLNMYVKSVVFFLNALSYVASSNRDSMIRLKFINLNAHTGAPLSLVFLLVALAPSECYQESKVAC